jgi:hypothetical protein
MPHPANFAPVGAVALLGGMLLPRKFAAWTVVAVMILSDLLLGLHPLVLWTWGSFALIALLANALLSGQKVGTSRLVISAIGGGTVFFVITNVGVWLQGGLYEKSWQGLLQCFANAIPFYRNTILGDVFFVSVFYATYLVVSRLAAVKPSLAHQAGSAA